ncbi:unnamed protein product [Clonostachys chloroleuca]|uniref:Uncharacterized protein n=1 Tax=Clonostachys chloroleuca TaxID=1926264 RepID=A0AA35V9P7_9HYPO|nr:unnamed protein product [Clonostachys chloroleuca]
MAPSPRVHMNPPTPHRVQNRPMLKTELLRAGLQLASVPSTLVRRAEVLPPPVLVAHLMAAPVLLAEPAPPRHPPLVAADVDALVVGAVAARQPLLLAPVHLAVVAAAERRHDTTLPRVAEHGAVRRRLAPPVPVAEPLGIRRSLPAAGHAALAALVSAGHRWSAQYRRSWPSRQARRFLHLSAQQRSALWLLVVGFPFLILDMSFLSGKPTELCAVNAPVGIIVLHMVATAYTSLHRSTLQIFESVNYFLYFKTQKKREVQGREALTVITVVIPRRHLLYRAQMAAIHRPARMMLAVRRPVDPAVHLRHVHPVPANSPLRPASLGMIPGDDVPRRPDVLVVDRLEWSHVEGISPAFYISAIFGQQ